MFIFSLSVLLAVNFCWAQENQDLKAFKSDINDATIDRVRILEEYIEKMSSQFIQTSKNLEAQIKKNAELEKKIAKGMSSDNQSTSMEQLTKTVESLEKKIAKLSPDEVNRDLKSVKSELSKTNVEILLIKSLLNEVKTYLINNHEITIAKDKSKVNSSLNETIDNIRKIYLTEKKSAASTNTEVKVKSESDNFLDKFSLRTRRSFCKTEANAKKFKKECLPYIK